MRTSQPFWAAAFLCLCLSIGSLLMTPMPSAPHVQPLADIESETDTPVQYTAQNTDAEIAATGVLAANEADSPAELFTRARSLYEGRNYDDAFVLFERSAKGGHAEAQYMTGYMLARGQGVPLVNEDEAVRYYTMSAKSGFAKAQAALGMMYYNGTTTMARDTTEAYKWFYLASLQGDQRGLKMLSRVQKDMDEQQAPATASSGLMTPQR